MYGLLLYLALVAGILPCVLYYKSGLNRCSSAIFFFLPFFWLTAIASAYETVGTLYLRIDTTIWFRAYDLLEFAALYYFFYNVILRKSSVYWSVFPIVYSVTYLVLIYFWHNFNELQVKSILSLISVSFIIVSVLLWLNRNFRSLQDSLKTNQALLLVISAVFLYYVSTLFLFLAANNIYVISSSTFGHYWQLNIAATLIFRTLLIVSVCIAKRK